MKKFCGILVGFLLVFATCANSPPPASVSGDTENQQKIMLQAGGSSAMPSAYVPKYALDEAEQYKKEFMRENSRAASDLSYRFFYNEIGEACLEFTVVPKAGYTFSTQTWIGYTWGNARGGIGLGEIIYTLTKKNHDESEYRIDERRKDPVFRDIEKVVFDITKEYNYDFFGAYGIKVNYRRPNVKRAVCEGYSDAVEKAFKNHSAVRSVETWTSTIGNHAWNVLILNDGRKLYCDTTWYGGNSIDEEGYVVDVPLRTPYNLTFDINEFNSQGGAVDNATGRLVAVHFNWRDAQVKR